jgi:3-methyl-2-oxobutanoate hydroxymethyltransferase
VPVNGSHPRPAAVSDGSQSTGVAASHQECDDEDMVDNFMSAGTNGGDDELPSPYGTGPANQTADQPDPRYDTRQPQVPDYHEGPARSPYTGGEPATTAPPAPEYDARAEQPAGPPRPIWYQPDADQRPVTPGYPVQPQPQAQPQRPAGPDPRHQAPQPDAPGQAARQQVQPPGEQPARAPVQQPAAQSPSGTVPLTDDAWQARRTDDWQGPQTQATQTHGPEMQATRAQGAQQASPLPAAPQFAGDRTAAHPATQPVADQGYTPDDATAGPDATQGYNGVQAAQQYPAEEVSETRLSDALSGTAEHEDSETRLSDALRGGTSVPAGPEAAVTPEPGQVPDAYTSGEASGVAAADSVPADVTSSAGEHAGQEGAPSDSVTVAPAATDCATTPSSDRGTSDGTATDGLAADGPATDSPAYGGPANDIAADDSATNDSATNQGPAGDSSAAEGRPADIPTTDNPAADIPTAEVPTSEIPATEIPATDAPTTEIAAADQHPGDAHPGDHAAEADTDGGLAAAAGGVLAAGTLAGAALSGESTTTQPGGPESAAPVGVQAQQSTAPQTPPAGQAPAGGGSQAPRKRKRIRIHHLREMKDRGEKWSMLTAYDQYTAEIFDQAGIEVLLVGDSAANNVYGYESTLRISVEELLALASGVARAVSHTLVVADLPFGSYQASAEQAFHTAVRFMKDAGVHAVKLEGGRTVVPQVTKLVEAGIPVMGHIGFTPQSEHGLGGYRVQGRGESAAGLIDDAVALAEAGAFAIVLEMVPGDLAAEITKRVPVPTIGIGAGRDCDAQVLVWQDMAGLRSGPMPRFVKRYADLRSVLSDAATAFAADVSSGAFPGDEHTF